MITSEWLKLPRFTRLYRILFCPHPFYKSKKVGVLRIKEKDISGMRFVVNIWECGCCLSYFIDSGLEDDK
jgi:hypothetical protein